MESYKVNIEDVPFAEGLGENEGWEGLELQWLIDHNAGATKLVFGRSIFAPGTSHALHRHPNADEFFYVIQGQGLVVNGDDEIVMNPGDLVLSPVNVWHSFRNLSQTEDVVALWGYGGAASLEEAGYEVKES